MPLIEFPLGLKGRMFGSAMPFGLYDPDGLLFREMKEARVSAVVVLAEAEECREKAGRDLEAFYGQEGLTVIPLAIPNYGIPQGELLTVRLKDAIECAAQGQNVLIHCSAGIGRTVHFVSLLAKVVLGVSGIEAIRWVSQYKPDALLTPPQILLILDSDR